MDRVEALVFDTFGTVVDWRSSIIRELERASNDTVAGLTASDRLEFAHEWRRGYMSATKTVAQGGERPLNTDILHRQILDMMLQSPRWSNLDILWQDSQRRELTLAWHKLDAWPDVTDGLLALKEHFIVMTLSNGNFRLLVDLAKHAKLPWDAILSTELFGTFKPNGKVYSGTAYHLSLPPSCCAMVACHIFDLRGAASQGMKTIYVRREAEEVIDDVKTKAEGGEVDLVVDCFTELASILCAA